MLLPRSEDFSFSKLLQTLVKEQQLRRSSAEAQGKEVRGTVGEEEEIPKAGIETVHLRLESRITPCRLRTTLKEHAAVACTMSFAFIPERNLAQRWAVLSSVSHKQTFELSIYITV